MTKIAFVFAGQGVQKIGMGTELLEEPAYREVYNKLDKDLQELILSGPKENLDNTLNAQPCIVATSLSIANVLKEKGVDCSYVAGLSLGEYSALAYSGVLSVEDTLAIVKERSKIMTNALPLGTTGMLAVLNTEVAIIEENIKDVANLQIANYNSPKQIVLTGSLEAIDYIAEKFKEQRIKTIKLNVSGAFHSDYLIDASKKLEEVLKQYKFNESSKKIVFNTVGAESEKNIVDLLKDQIKSSVKFMQSIEYMIEQGVDTFLEIGPGKVLSGLIKQINKNVKVYQVEDKKSIDKILEEI